DPLVVAKLQDRLGRTYLGLGISAKAESLFAKAVAIRQVQLGSEHSLTLRSRYHQAVAIHTTGKKRPEAIVLFEQVRDGQVKTLGGDHLETLTTLNDLGRAYWLAGRMTEAIELLEHVRDAQRQLLGEDSPHTLATLANLIGAYLHAGKK